MRERVKRYSEQFERALINLKTGAESAVDDLDIDGTIKRFELCYELSWKLIKEYLADLGLICKSPRECFKFAFENRLIDSENNWTSMIDDRNALVHTYTHEESREIFQRIKSSYIGSFEFLLHKVIQGE